MQRHLIVFAVALIAATPTSLAFWSTHGDYEPDSFEDRSQGWMYADPDTSADGPYKVYFNGWMNAYFTGINTNTGVTGSAIWGAPIMTPFAVLGVWRDCNKDGYIGLGDSALAEYPAGLLADASVCPPDSIFQIDGWVYEFHHIGPDDVDFEGASTFPAVINDTAAKVWADVGRPGPGTGGGTCAINPQPRGTFASTGGFLAYADCLGGRRISTTVNSVDPDCSITFDGRPLCFRDPQDIGNSDSILNQDLVNLWGDPYAKGGYQDGLLEKDRNNNDVQPYFTTWDCSEPIGVDIGEQLVVGDPTNGDLVVTDPTGGQLLDEPFDPWPITIGDEHGFVASGLYMPAPSTRETLVGYSLFEGANATASNCNADGSGLPEPSNEADYGGSAQGAAKRSHDFEFAFSNAVGAGFAGFVYGPILEEGGAIPPDVPRSIPRPVPGAPDDFGVGVFRAMLYGFVGPGWGGSPNLVVDPQLVNRGDLQPSGPGYFTYYAKLGGATTAIAATPKGGVGVYASEWCGSATSGVVNGVDCDGENWWDPDYGAGAMPTQTDGQIDGTCTRGLNEPQSNCREIGASAGEAYHMRDTDCYDGQLVRDTFVRASLVDLSSTGPCAR